MAARTPGKPAATKRSAPTSTAGPTATIDTRCGRCGRPVLASVDKGALVLTDPGQSEHDCAAG